MTNPRDVSVLPLGSDSRKPAQQKEERKKDAFLISCLLWVRPITTCILYILLSRPRNKYPPSSQVLLDYALEPELEHNRNPTRKKKIARVIIHDNHTTMRIRLLKSRSMILGRRGSHHRLNGLLITTRSPARTNDN